MGYAFDAVAQRMGVVVERVDAPFVAYVRVMVEFDPVDDWISQSCIGMLDVDLCSQGISAFFVQAQSHLVEQSEVLFDWSVSVF